MTNSFRKNDNYLKIRLFAKIRLLGRNSKIRSGEDTPRCLEVLHAEFHDAPTLNQCKGPEWAVGFIDNLCWVCAPVRDCIAFYNMNAGYDDFRSLL